MPEITLPRFEMIRLALRGSVAVLTLNRPQRLNAAPPQMFAEIDHALRTLPGLGARALSYLLDLSAPPHKTPSVGR